MEHLTLQQVIDMLNPGNAFGICVHDISGLLELPALAVRPENTVHSGKFCHLAKSTDQGFRLCLRCKGSCNRIATRRKTGFSGLCAFGRFEAVQPVVIGGKTACILYIGTGWSNPEAARRKLQAACEKAGVSHASFARLLQAEPEAADPEGARRIAALLDSYIRLLYQSHKDDAPAAPSPYHWAVGKIKAYADANYARHLTLEEVCRLYFVNEKYAGKLFRSQLGASFHEYLNWLRLEAAGRILAQGEEKILSVALRCGYSDVSYFNRQFRKHYGMSPSEYRTAVRLGPKEEPYEHIHTFSS